MEAPDAFAISRQAAWEVRAAREGAKRFADALAHKDPAELPAAQRALREVAAPVVAEISRRQDDALGPTKNPAPWHAPLALFDPEVLAVVAIATAMNASPSAASPRDGMSISAFSRAVAAALRDQSDHDRWLEDQRKASKANDEDGRAAKALLRRWERQNPRTNRRAWARFAGRIEGARSRPWDANTRMAVGGVLLEALVAAAPAWFELRLVSDGRGASTYRLSLTTHAAERVADAEARAEVSRPLLLPMLIPPNPWRYAAKARGEAHE